MKPDITNYRILSVLEVNNERTMTAYGLAHFCDKTRRTVDRRLRLLHKAGYVENIRVPSKSVDTNGQVKSVNNYRITEYGSNNLYLWRALYETK